PEKADGAGSPPHSLTHHPLRGYPPPHSQGGTNMEQEKALARIRELEGEVQRLTAELAAAAGDGETGGQGDGETGRRDGGGMSEAGSLTLPVSPTPTDEAAALVADGKAYRQHLRAEVQRLAGILKSEAEASLLLKALPHAPVDALKELLASYQARV